MAATKVFLDSGPLVGFLSQTDQHHHWALEIWNRLYDPLLALLQNRLGCACMSHNNVGYSASAVSFFDIENG